MLDPKFISPDQTLAEDGAGRDGGGEHVEGIKLRTCELFTIKVLLSKIAKEICIQIYEDIHRSLVNHWNSHKQEPSYHHV